MKKWLIGLAVIAVAVGVFRVPVLKAVTASYNQTVRIVDSSGNVIGGVASASTASYNQTVQVVDSNGNVLNSFGCANPLNAGDLLVGLTNTNTCPTNLASSSSTAGQYLQAGGSGVGPTWANLPLYTGGVLSGAQSTANLGLLWTTPTNGVHLTRFTVAMSTPPATCTGYPAFQVVDCGTSAPTTTAHCAGGTALATLTTATGGAFYYDSGAVSVAVAGGHYIEVYTSTAENTCSTHVSVAAFSETWTTP